MDKIVLHSVDDYMALQPRAAVAKLELVRSALRRALPRAEEVISYKIPGYKLNDEIVIYFAGWKKHYSLYPAGEALLTALSNELASYEISKGTIRFPLSEPVPVKLIERIAKFRAKEAADRVRTKSDSPKNR